MVGKCQKTAQQNPAKAPPVPTSQANASSTATSKDAKTEATTEDGSSVEVLSTISSMQSDFSKKFEDVLAGLSGLKGDLQNQANKITEAEERIGRAEDNLNSMHSVIKRLQEKLEIKAEDQENGVEMVHS